MDSELTTRGFTRTGYAIMAITLALSAGWSSTVLGATSSLVPCDQIERDLISLDVTVAALSVNLVDHVTTELGAASFAEAADSTDSMAPLLFLTPRVATIIRDVFAPATASTPLAGKEKVQTSPLADSVEETRSTDAVDEAEIALPRFQRQMFRTDI